ncbi:MAG: hypothetical protein M3069_07515 [Chloroflexota bacterium]|nr:hypothetical protein [Chloroflexota bacterium]
MWRNYVICVLIGLLLVSTGGSVVLTRQVITTQADADRLRQRLAASESARASLQQQLDRLASAQTPGAPATPGAPVPTVAVGGSADQAVFQRIEDDVAGLRGLQPKSQVPLRFLDQAALQRYFVDRFNQDYLPGERESDQKLLETLGLVKKGESVTQILLDVLQEQVIGVYNQDDKAMYLVTSDTGQFGPQERDTFAHEYTHALQDQYFDLTALAPKHPENDDRSLAIQALTEGDATLMQRLWAQEKLGQDEITQLGQGGADSKLLSAPLFLREQLLFPYSDGFNFIRQIYQSGGGYAGVDDVFRNPPDSTAQILHIDKYRGRVKPIDVSLPDLSQGSLGDGWRQINSNVLGELDIRLILTQLTDTTHGVRGSGGWAGDRWQLLEKDGRQALVISSVWDTQSDASNFFQAFALGMKNRFPSATEEEASTTRQALTAPTAATEIRRQANSVSVVISYDRPTAEALMSALTG